MIAWFARNHVAANLLMVLIIFAGAYALFAKLPLEVFPSIELDIVSISTPVEGSTPEDIETGVTIKVEEAIQDLEGIDQIVSFSSETRSYVRVEVESDYPVEQLQTEIKTRVDALNDLSELADRPVVSRAVHRRDVLSVAVSGDLNDRELRFIAEQVRQDITQLESVTQASLESAQGFEIGIEVSEARLREYGLTLQAVADAVRVASVDLSGGRLRTPSGEYLLTARGQAYTGTQFEDILVVTQNDGSQIFLKDIATVSDGFEEVPVETRFNGKKALVIEVFRVGQQSAIEIADSVKQYIEIKQAQLPPSVSLTVWRDRSNIVKKRLNTLLRSATQGAALVLLLLALFLRPAVAFWVCVGIPISFLGGLAAMPLMGITINIVSLFAFIVVLGIVVDDAIVTGENIYTHIRRGEPPESASITGTQEVALPVTFGVLTTVAAFLPLFFIAGRRGDVFAQIPAIIIPVLLFSLVESKLILPAHLRHIKADDDRNQHLNPLIRVQRAISFGLERFILNVYQPFLGWVLRHRYLVLSIFIGLTLIIFTYASSGWMRFLFFPRVQSELARATLEMPVGTAIEQTDQYIERIAKAAQALQQTHTDPDSGESVISNILSTTGSTGGGGSGSSHLGRVTFEIVPPEDRRLSITSSELVREWRELIGNLPGAESITYRAELGRGGDPIDVSLKGDDLVALQAVAEAVKQRLTEYPGVFDIGDSFSAGKQELTLALKPTAHLTGVTLSQVSQQVRQAFYGIEAQVVQRGRNEVKVMVRYPLQDRSTQAALERMQVRTQTGAEIPLLDLVELIPRRGPAEIMRIDRQRTLSVSADINKETASIEQIKTDLEQFLGQLVTGYPSVSYSLEGEAREQRETFESLRWATLFVLFVLYALLAIPFRSYWQPLIVMSVIPFGLNGAILGHIIMGADLTIISMLGMLALSGVVVNDSLVLVDYINKRRIQSEDILKSIRESGAARFRPVMLTSLTTFAGLTPLLFEKSTQAQFLIPMAISLGFGILFATLITLLLIPINYAIMEDVKRALGRGPGDTAVAATD